MTPLERRRRWQARAVERAPSRPQSAEPSVAHGGSAHPQVAVMRAVRNVLLDEIPIGMGGNETHPHLRWPQHDAVRSVMHSRRGSGTRLRGCPFPAAKVEGA